MKVLITLLGRIGDMILLTPSFKLIKDKYPEAQIDIIASRHNYIIPKLNPHINYVYIYDKKFVNVIKLIYRLRREFYDFYIDPKDHFSRESYIFSRIVKARKKIGYNRPGYNNFDISVDNSQQNKNLFHSIRILKSLKHLGIEVPELLPKPILFEEPNSKEYVEKNFPKFNDNRQIALLNISASKDYRMWKIENWEKFIDEFSKNNIYFILSCEPRHKPLAERLIGKNSFLFPSRNFNDIVSLVRKVDLVVTPDTSIVHVASAWNKPTFALYVGHEYLYWWFRPVSDYNRSVLAPDGKDVPDIDYDTVKNEFYMFINNLHID